ncbi:MAG: GTPase HflX [Actinomycetota bacterium]|nr:MAG: GTPase HflX [Actinomycetota bacterium]
MTKEKVLLIFIDFTQKVKDGSPGLFTNISVEDRIEELTNLTISADAEVEQALSYRQKKPNPKYFISTGRLEQIKNALADSEIELVIFDDEITPTQQRNLQNTLNVKVLDRTALILDIFAQRARSSEGKLQVELAQSNYLLPRLIGKGIELSRLGGGIGTRGPGETKLEVDRRVIRKRITSLEKRIDQISIQRDTQRKSRSNNIYQAALVGYTNSGKSTLLNTLTRSKVDAKNMLFSTLDSTTRKLNLDVKPDVLLTDTVGFIEKLPHQLIAAFKSTLEEVRVSDLLVLIVDISNNSFEANISSVKKVLKDIDVWGKPFIMVFNKIDKIDAKMLDSLKLKYKNSIFISALRGIGLDSLKDRIKKNIEKHNLNIVVKIPHNAQKIISFIYKKCQVLAREDMDSSVVFNLNIEPKYSDILKVYYINSKKKVEKKTRNIS